ncbi:protein phosphatase 2C domain-containing protein [Umezawaea beigongshangensis]|uniref:protein phosphatase 2C domain-containing protein n=1 Tax=Umezawaea beigongshangensis TaxID=2780383 RepID=UPI0018F17FA7|nr:protein phosphatase 2C domain-containing protein [Umezawaea beigongshangensis]
MRSFISTMSVQKDGSRPHETEDASAVLPDVARDEEVEGQVLAAIADGASESVLAGPWARLLAESFVHAAATRPNTLRNRRTFGRAVLGVVHEWEDWLAGYVADREANDRPIRWYEQPGLDRGAYATLLAFQLAGTHGQRWYAAAMGDSCLFQVRDGALSRTFPLDSAEEFGTSPNLLNSRNTDEDLIAERVRLTQGSYREGDQFFLATDALAAWFLAEKERDGAPWDVLRELACSGTDEDFADWVTKQRGNGDMRNDDVALVHVDLG